MTEQKRVSIEEENRDPHKAYLFDVDGVLTDPETIEIQQTAIIDELIKRLQAGNPVGFNTGLSLKNMDDMVLNPLAARIPDKRLLRNVVVIAEKGGAYLTFDEEGKRNEFIDENIRVPQVLQDEINALVREAPYADTMQVNSTKRTMVTLVIRSKEERGEKTFEDFQNVQEKLTEEIQKLVQQHDLADTFKVDKTRIAIDVESKQVGKDFGARKFVQILEERGISPQEYISFGDSVSDYHMHEEFRRLGKNARFVYVGGREQLADKNLDGVIFTQQHVDKGTLEYLQSE